MVQVVENPDAMQETRETQERRIWPLDREDPLEKEMATHSNKLAWEILWKERLTGLQSMESQIVGHDWACTQSAKLSLGPMFLAQYCHL